MLHTIKQNLKGESKANRKIKQKRKRIIKTILNNNHDRIR